MLLRRALAAVAFVLALVAFTSPSTGAQAAGPVIDEMPPAERAVLRSGRSITIEPLALTERVGVAPLATLTDAVTGAGDQLAGLRAWNASGRRPFQSGFVRPLPIEQPVLFDGELPVGAGPHDGGLLVRRGGDGLVWGAEVLVEGSYRIKLHLRDVELPLETRIWVFDESGEAKGPFGPEAVVAGGLWTPAVRGPVIRLEVELPETPVAGSGIGFVVDAVAETVRLDADGAPIPADGGGLVPRVDSSCLVNAECVPDLDVPVIDVMQAATALVFFVDRGRVFVCSGGLLNSQSHLPFFLTANHCISTRASAASADLFWDYWQECDGGVNPDFEESFGAELLATGKSSDFTLMLLDFVPPGRAFLGWTADPAAAAAGTTLHRVSHPIGDAGIFPHSYSSHRVLENPFTCSPGLDDPPVDDLTKFAYSELIQGGTLGGSSGSPLVTDDGQVVGQLLGGCGPNPFEGCDRRNHDIDGLFQETFQSVSTYLLDPEGDGFVPPPGADWLSTSDLPGYEAQVRITAGSAIAGNLETDCIPETLCVSGALAGRSEVFVKVIGPRPNGYYWAQISRFSPSKLEIWLRQTATGEINYYILDAVGNDTADVPGFQDRQAFVP